MYVSAFWIYQKAYEPRTFVLLLIGILCYLLTMILLNHLMKKFELTSSNTLTIILFAFLSALFPYSLLDIYMIIANLLLLTAVNFLISMSNNRSIKGKILNASMCVALASLSYSWCIVMMLLVYLAIWYFDRKEYRNWLIPLVGLGAIAILSICFHLIVYNEWRVFSLNVLSYSLKNLQFQFSVKEMFGFGCFILCSLFFIAVYIYKFKKRLTRLKPIFNVFMWYYVVSFVIILFFSEYKSAGILLAVTPLSVIGTSYLESIQNKLVSEITLWAFLILPFFTFFL